MVRARRGSLPRRELRPEFLGQLLASPQLAGLAARTFALRPLRREALTSVIEGPARVAGIGVDAGLVATLVADADAGQDPAAQALRPATALACRWNPASSPGRKVNACFCIEDTTVNALSKVM
jgi:hypothetical protein